LTKENITELNCTTV